MADEDLQCVLIIDKMLSGIGVDVNIAIILVIVIICGV